MRDAGPVECFRIPDSIRAYDSDVEQLAVGSVGKNGKLRLVFQRYGTGRTVIGEQFSEVPLHIQRALYYDDACPNMAYVYVVSASGGILQGDRYKTDIIMREGSMAHITTQGATRIYSMSSNYAAHTVNITLEKDSYLEFIPDQIIPYRNSRFYQGTNINVHDSATMIYSEIITPGRVAMGESFEYDICHIRTAAANQKNMPRCIDVTRLEPKRQKLDSFGILGRHAVAGSIYILTRRNLRVLLDIIRGAISTGGVSGGASIMNDDGGLLVRILGDSTEDVRNVILEVVGHARHAVVGSKLPEIRKS